VPHIAGALEALLCKLIDYAGLYPPAGLPLPIVVERYRAFLASPDRWLLNRLVLPAARLAEASLDPGWSVTLLVDDEPGPLPPQVETLESKKPGRLSLPTYCEAPLAEIEGAFAKVRTGGLTPEAVPSSASIADFLCAAALRKIPFKATAGLHHPIRSERPLTYAPDSPRAVMHGFLNVFAAAAFAWHGMDRERVQRILDETDAAVFEFDDAEMRWRGVRLSVTQIREARAQFAHSFGSCSFEEPLSDLRSLGLLE
jgi:hypothetical protein